MLAGVNDYQRIASIIQFLDEHHVEQPDLESLARRAGLSAFHFHRLFSNWAGITPKDFVQCLTVEHARNLLRRGESVLSASLEAGLSGPGRLHDLCVTLEAASPGELKSGGAGLEIRYGLAETPFGEWLSAETDRGICFISFADAGGFEDMKERWPAARLVRDDAGSARLSEKVFEDSVVDRRLSAHVRGTPFQVRVWRALLEIPPGRLVSYGSIATAIGCPGASRAVGTAVGANPISYLIPCHRVIRETGVIGNYRWGRDRKRSMIAWETAGRA